MLKLPCGKSRFGNPSTESTVTPLLARSCPLRRGNNVTKKRYIFKNTVQSTRYFSAKHCCSQTGAVSGAEQRTFGAMKPVLVLAILAVLFLRLADSVPRPLDVVVSEIRSAHFRVEENQCWFHMGMLYFKGRMSGNFTERHFVNVGIVSKSYMDRLQVSGEQYRHDERGTYFEWNIGGHPVTHTVDMVDITLSTRWGDPKKYAACVPQVRMDYSSQTINWYLQRSMRDDNWGLLFRTLLVYLFSLVVLVLLTVGVSARLRFI